MMDKKELSDEELEEVSGGLKRINTNGNLGDYADYNKPVDKYSGTIGEKYLFKKNDSNSAWLFGTLINSYERWISIFNTERTHDIIVEDGYGNYGCFNPRVIEVHDGGTKEISGDSYQMYAK